MLRLCASSAPPSTCLLLGIPSTAIPQHRACVSRWHARQHTNTPTIFDTAVRYLYQRVTKCIMLSGAFPAVVERMWFGSRTRGGVYSPFQRASAVIAFDCHADHALRRLHRNRETHGEGEEGETGERGRQIDSSNHQKHQRPDISCFPLNVYLWLRLLRAARCRSCRLRLEWPK